MAKGSVFSQIQCLIVGLPDGSERRLIDYLLPSAILMLAALLLLISIFLPYWSMTMTAPQYPKGLTVDVYVNHLQGDMREIDELNHYLGMPPLDEAGRLERSFAVYAITALGLLLIAGVFIGNQWAGVLALPVFLYPIVFLNVQAALANIDPALDEAARNLGAGAWRRFWRITCPMMRPGVLAGSTIVFIWAFTELGTPLLASPFLLDA